MNTFISIVMAIAGFCQLFLGYADRKDIELCNIHFGLAAAVLGVAYLIDKGGRGAR